MLVVQFFEAVMLILFGCSWPFLIAKLLRTRKVHGMSIVFLYIVFIGYLAGITAKLIKAQVESRLPDAVTILYAVNAALVMTAIVLYYRFRCPPDEQALDIQPENPGAEATADDEPEKPARRQL
jgi:multisubunit Na+/H+ antiporter MnhC subunit